MWSRLLEGSTPTKYRSSPSGSRPDILTASAPETGTASVQCRATAGSFSPETASGRIPMPQADWVEAVHRSHRLQFLQSSKTWHNSPADLRAVPHNAARSAQRAARSNAEFHLLTTMPPDCFPVPACFLKIRLTRKSADIRPQRKTETIWLKSKSEGWSFLSFSCPILLTMFPGQTISEIPWSAQTIQVPSILLQQPACSPTDPETSCWTDAVTDKYAAPGNPRRSDRLPGIL